MRLEMGQPQIMNDQNKVFEPIFYKGMTSCFPYRDTVFGLPNMN